MNKITESKLFEKFSFKSAQNENNTTEKKINLHEIKKEIQDIKNSLLNTISIVQFQQPPHLKSS
jgi:hypothetical protein